ncbi:MAG: hypothetical protein EXR75_15780, partial [Myxococcales bacterium]|nr:hypothetical protein [Myxococcales bacterium]
MIIQISDLNDERFGRFGNQLFKYFFLKVLEREIGCEIRHPRWLGNLAFDIPASAPPEQTEDVLVIHPADGLTLGQCLALVAERVSLGVRTLDLKGFFQFHTRDISNYKELFFDTFKFKPHLLAQITDALKLQNPNGHNVITTHLRRSDYAHYQDNPLFWLTPIESVFKSLELLGRTSYSGRLIYLCSDDMPSCVREFTAKGVPF